VNEQGKIQLITPKKTRQKIIPGSKPQGFNRGIREIPYSKVMFLSFTHVSKFLFQPRKQRKWGWKRVIRNE